MELAIKVVKWSNNGDEGARANNKALCKPGNTKLLLVFISKNV